MSEACILIAGLLVAGSFAAGSAAAGISTAANFAGVVCVVGSSAVYEFRVQSLAECMSAIKRLEDRFFFSSRQY